MASHTSSRHTTFRCRGMDVLTVHRCTGASISSHTSMHGVCVYVCVPALACLLYAFAHIFSKVPAAGALHLLYCCASGLLYAQLSHASENNNQTFVAIIVDIVRSVPAAPPTPY